MRKIIFVLLGAAALAAIALAVYFFLLAPKTIQSSHAYVSEAAIEIKTLQPGKITFIAQHGQPVNKGELLLQTDASHALSGKQTAEDALAKLEAGLHPYTIRIFNKLAGIPQSSTELTQEFQLTKNLFEQAEKRVTATSIEQASAQLAMRKLELQKNRIAEDNVRLAELRATDKQLTLKLEQERSQRDGLSSRMSTLERRIHERKSSETAFAGLPDEQKLLFAEAEKLFDIINNAEDEIQKSKILAPIDGIVIQTMVEAGNETFFGETCLLLAAPDQKAQVTAFFQLKDAERLTPGMTCTVEFEPPERWKATGKLVERLPKNADTTDSEIALLVNLDINTASQLAKLRQRQTVTVQLKTE